MYQVVGIGERRTGTAAKTGKPYDFTEIFCVRTAPKVTGQVAEKITLSHTSGLTYPVIAVGDTLNIFFDQQGFLQELTIAEKGGGKGNDMPPLPDPPPRK